MALRAEVGDLPGGVSPPAAPQPPAADVEAVTMIPLGGVTREALIEAMQTVWALLAEVARIETAADLLAAQEKARALLEGKQ